jgi:hypothetical protein
MNADQRKSSNWPIAVEIPIQTADLVDCTDKKGKSDF